MNMYKTILKVGGTAAAVVGLKILTDKFIFDQDGYNNLGYDRNGYNQYGFNKHGFNSSGYNDKGYNKDGYDKCGYNSRGYDVNGYNLEGYNSKGYDIYGFDRSGRNKSGFDINGLDMHGYDVNGFNITGYNCLGRDRGGNNEEHYVKKCIEMNNLLEKAYIQMKLGNFPYALRDIRVGLEMGIRCIVEHKNGKSYSSIFKNLEMCTRYSLLDEEFIQKLHSAKTHCNDTQHDSYTEAKSYNEVFFTYKILEQLIGAVKKLAIGNCNEFRTIDEEFVKR